MTPKKQYILYSFGPTDLYEILFCSDKTLPCEMTSFVETCVGLSHLLVCFNSSANFVIYLLAGEKFRKVWFQVFCPRQINLNAFEMESMHGVASHVGKMKVLQT
jgi:hypothetical protein